MARKVQINFRLKDEATKASKAIREAFKAMGSEIVASSKKSRDSAVQIARAQVESAKNIKAANAAIRAQRSATQASSKAGIAASKAQTAASQKAVEENFRLASARAQASRQARDQEEGLLQVRRAAFQQAQAQARQIAFLAKRNGVAVAAAQKKTEAAAKSQAQAQVRTSQAFLDTARSIGRFVNAASRSDKVVRRAFRAMLGPINRARRQIRVFALRTLGLQRAFRIAQRAARKSFRVIGRSVIRARGAIRRMAASLRGMRGVLLTLGAGLVLRSMVKMATTFEASMSKIVGLVGVSREQVNAWKDDLDEIALEVGKAPTELAEALFFVTSAGLRGAEAIEVLRASAKAAAAGMGETKVVADAATSAMNAFGVENLSAEKAVGILVATVREGKAAADSIAGALGRVLPIAAEAGVSFDQVGAAIAAMTRIGLPAEIATVSLRAVIASFIKVGPQAAKALEEIGLSASEMRKELRERGLLSVLFTLRKAIAGNEDALSEIVPNIRAVTGVLSLVGKNAKLVRGIFKALGVEVGQSLEIAFGEKQTTALFSYQVSLARLRITFRKFGEALQPILTQVADFATIMIDRIAKSGVLDLVKQGVIDMTAALKRFADTADLGAIANTIADAMIKVTEVIALVGAAIIDLPRNIKIAVLQIRKTLAGLQATFLSFVEKIPDFGLLETPTLKIKIETQDLEKARKQMMQFRVVVLETGERVLEGGEAFVSSFRLQQAAHKIATERMAKQHGLTFDEMVKRTKTASQQMRDEAAELGAAIQKELSMPGAVDSVGATLDRVGERLKAFRKSQAALAVAAADAAERAAAVPGAAAVAPVDTQGLAGAAAAVSDALRDVQQQIAARSAAVIAQLRAQREAARESVEELFRMAEAQQKAVPTTEELTSALARFSPAMVAAVKALDPKTLRQAAAAIQEVKDQIAGAQGPTELWQAEVRRLVELMQTAAPTAQQMASKIALLPPELMKVALAGKITEDQIDALTKKLGDQQNEAKAATAAVAAEAKAQQQELANFGRMIASSTADFGLQVMDAAFTSGKDFVKDFGKLAQDMIRDLAREILRLTIQKAILSGLGVAAGGVAAGGAAAAGAAASGAAAGFAKGGVMGGSFMPFQAMANGGVFSQPTLGLVSEGPRNEAVIPLPDNRNVPVKFVGGGGPGQQAPNVTVNISAVDAPSFQQLLATPAGEEVVLAMIAKGMRTRPRFRKVVGGLA